MNLGKRVAPEQMKIPRIEDSVYQFRHLKANRQDIRLLRYCGLIAGLLTFQLVQFEYDNSSNLAAAVSANQTLPSPKFRELDELIRPPYIALSYEWGNQTDRRPIVVDEIQVSITRNLHDALQQLTKLHHLDSINKIRWIWVDALCIRQDDRDYSEKHSLIPNMDEIYRKADAVYAWVGKKSPESHNAMTILQEFASTEAEEKSAICSLWPEPCSQYCWDDMLHFADRSFWRRLWIVQEITLARKVMVVCGNQVVNFAGIQRMLASVGGRSSNNLRFLRTLHLCRLDLRKYRKPLKLLKVLWMTRRSLTQSLTDRVYALLAMCTDWRDFLDEPKSTMSEIELNLHMTQRWLQRTYSLDIILLAPALTELRDRLPSWCPDFLNLSSRDGGNPAQGSLIDYLASETRGRTINPASSGWWEAFEMRKLGAITDLWQTTKESQLSDRAMRRTRDQLLEVKGILVDRVKIAKLTKRSAPDPRLLHYLIEAFCLYDPSFEDRAHCALFLIIMFWMCLGCEYSDLFTRMTSCAAVNDWLDRNRCFNFRGHTIQSIVEVSHMSYLSEMRNPAWLLSQGISPHGKMSLYDLQKTYFEHKLAKNPQAFTNSFLAFRRLVLEELLLIESVSGYFGWGPTGADALDEIYLLKGCSFPVVLRPSKGNAGRIHYTVVGRAYLPHLMSGSVWERQKQQLRTIVLK